METQVNLIEMVAQTKAMFLSAISKMPEDVCDREEIDRELDNVSLDCEFLADEIQAEPEVEAFDAMVELRTLFKEHGHVELAKTLDIGLAYASRSLPVLPVAA